MNIWGTRARQLYAILPYELKAKKPPASHSLARPNRGPPEPGSQALPQAHGLAQLPPAALLLSSKAPPFFNY